MLKQLIFPKAQKNINFIDRLEIKARPLYQFNFSTLKPFSRQSIVQEAEFFDSSRLGYSNSLTGDDNEWAGLNLTKIDEYNLHSILMDNSEWVTGSKESFLSKKPVLKTFLCYQTQSS